MELECLLPCLHQPTTELCTEPIKFNPPHHVLELNLTENCYRDVTFH
jgi:hypothetical protein